MDVMQLTTTVKTLFVASLLALVFMIQPPTALAGEWVPALQANACLNTLYPDPDEIGPRTCSDVITLTGQPDAGTVTTTVVIDRAATTDPWQIKVDSTAQGELCDFMNGQWAMGSRPPNWKATICPPPTPPGG